MSFSIPGYWEETTPADRGLAELRRLSELKPEPVETVTSTGACQFVHTRYSGPVGKRCLRPESEHCPGNVIECTKCGKVHHTFHRASKRRTKLDLGHEWFRYDAGSASWPCCKRCGIVQRADGQNKPCPGTVHVEPRGSGR